MRTIAAALACLVAGCQANSAVTVASTQMYGNARVIIDPARPNRLTLALVNTRDIGGYDFNRAADRATFVEAMLTLQCGKPSILDTQVTITGDTGMREFRLYTLTIDCLNGASRPAG